MKQVITILALFCTIVLFGQGSDETNSFINIFDTVSGLTHLGTLNCADITGTYFIFNGFVGYRLILDSNQTFQKIGFDCMSHSKVDSGKWKLQNGNTLVLTSDKTTGYDIIKLDNYYFIIPQSKRQQFVRDYLTTKYMYKNAKPRNIDGKIYSVEYFIGYSLIEKYFAKELKDFTGT